MRGAARRGWIAALTLAALAGCDAPMTPAPAPGGGPSAEAPAAPPSPRVSPTVPSETSQTLARYYARVQAGLLERGLLRRDGGGADTPFTSAMLARNFEQIALYDEYGGGNGTLRGRETEIPLRRWEDPVRISMEFGATVAPQQREIDRSFVRGYVARLANLTGHPITMTDSAPNFHVLVLNEDERRTIGPRLREIVPGINEGSVNTVENLPRGVLCLVLAFPGVEGDMRYHRAIALVRGEHPAQLREACFHEEIAQGLGLGNDSPAARPSIFNDNEEFALLTRQDELLLKILYDPRLSPGMTLDEAHPIIVTIAAELVGGPV
ncbi:DUF2927 domain-containing protein [Poseidonocella sedimentorum]